MKTVFKKLIAIIMSSLVTATGVLAGHLVIKGSTTALPIAQKTVEACIKANPDVKISLSGSGSSNGIKAIIHGSTDIANASRFIKDNEVSLAVGKGVYPVR